MKRNTFPASPADLRADHAVPLGVPFYLSCPIDSYHATYTWEHGGQRSPCLQMQTNCLHLIPAMEQENYGTYKCVSKEKGFTKVVKNYQLMEQKIGETTTGSGKADTPKKKNDASVFVPHIICIILGQAIAVLGVSWFCCMRRTNVQSLATAPLFWICLVWAVDIHFPWKAPSHLGLYLRGLSWNIVSLTLFAGG